MMKTIHAVGAIFEDPDKNILVLLRNPQDPEGNKWGLVGGKVDQGEVGAEALLREIKEEIGLEIDPVELKFIKTYLWNQSDLEVQFETFMVKVEHQFEPELERTENIDFKWIQPKEIYPRQDLMSGLYPILKDNYQV